MILVDTSVWIDHLRRADDQLRTLLEEGVVVTHPLVIGELACGSMARRDRVISLLRNLPATPEPSHDEVMHLIDRRRLHGRGIGFVDAHLLAAVLITPPARLWTRDRRLETIARELGVA